MITLILVIAGIVLGYRFTRKGNYNSTSKTLIIGGGALLGALLGSIVSNLIGWIIIITLIVLIVNTYRK
jgi:hypothetical protein